MFGIINSQTQNRSDIIFLLISSCYWTNSAHSSTSYYSLPDYSSHKIKTQMVVIMLCECGLFNKSSREAARKFVVLRMQLRAGRPPPRAKRPVAYAAAESWWESRKTCCCFKRLLFVIFSQVTRDCKWLTQWKILTEVMMEKENEGVERKPCSQVPVMSCLKESTSYEIWNELIVGLKWQYTESVAEMGSEESGNPTQWEC